MITATALTTSQAADLAGVSRQSIGKAIRRGRLSAERTPDGTWMVEPCELQRVYPGFRHNGDGADPNGFPLDAVGDTQGSVGCQAELALLRELCAAKDAHIATQAELIADLRRQFAELTAVVATLSAQPSATASKGPWWRRLLGGGE